jgi:hypothetical protein
VLVKALMSRERNGTVKEIYRIQVRGHLTSKWSDWFDGLQMSYCGEDTILTGSVLDQAALHGVLAKIRDLGLPILLVENLAREVEADDRS